MEQHKVSQFENEKFANFILEYHKQHFYFNFGTKYKKGMSLDGQCHGDFLLFAFNYGKLVTKCTLKTISKVTKATANKTVCT